jgi:hypothetical protein
VLGPGSSSGGGTCHIASVVEDLDQNLGSRDQIIINNVPADRPI